MQRKIQKEYNYDNLYLIPKKTIVDSRKECDTSVTLGKHTFSMPIIPSNMMTVVDESTCKIFADRGYFYIMHRFGIDNEKFVKSMQESGRYASISVGVNQDSYDQLISMKNNNVHPEYITIDIAHCWCPKGENMIKFIKDSFPDTFLIAGNIATEQSVEDLTLWGADCLKIGIGSGKVCTTKLNTGFTRGMVSCVLECSQYATIPIIADGGIREPGDIAKALCLGATMVMAGSIFAGFEESPGVIVEINGKKYKEYFGSSTQYSKGKNEHIEGKKILIEYKGMLEHYLKHLEESLRSSISYAGGKNLSALESCEIFILDDK